MRPPGRTTGSVTNSSSSTTTASSATPSGRAESATATSSGGTAATQQAPALTPQRASEAQPNAVPLASAANCRVNEQRRFSSCRAYASLGISHGETVSFSNFIAGYSGRVNAYCNDGTVTWSSGTCTAIQQAGTARSARVTANSVSLHDKKVFVASPPYAVLTRYGMKPVNLAPYPSKSQVPRAHDFVDAFIDPTTQRPNAFSVQTAFPEGGSVVYRNLYENSTPVLAAQGSPSRVEKRQDGLRVAYVANDPPGGDRLRTQLNSYPVPTRMPLTWDLSVRFGSTEEPWPVRPFTTSPVLIWQVIQYTSGYPPMGMIIDTDPADNNKLFLTVFQRAKNVPAYSHRWTVNGLERNRFHDIVINATLDDREPGEGGIGQLQIWVNGELIGDRVGRNLMTEVNDVHRWAFGVYQTNESKATAMTRATTWRRARLLVER